MCDCELMWETQERKRERESNETIISTDWLVDCGQMMNNYLKSLQNFFAYTMDS